MSNTNNTNPLYNSHLRHANHYAAHYLMHHHNHKPLSLLKPSPWSQFNNFGGGFGGFGGC